MQVELDAEELRDCERLRRLLHRRADALHDADQHQKGDRREGQHLRQPDAGEAVNPARWRNIECRGQELGHHAGPAEQQDHGKADGGLNRGDDHGEAADDNGGEHVEDREDQIHPEQSNAGEQKETLGK